MAYTDIPSTDLDAESPISEPLLVKLRDNISSHNHTSGQGANLISGSIASGALNNATLNSNIVGNAELKDEAVSSDKFATGSVTNSKLGIFVMRQNAWSTNIAAFNLNVSAGSATILEQGLYIRGICEDGIRVQYFIDIQWWDEKVIWNKANFIYSDGVDTRVFNVAGTTKQFRSIRMV